MLKLLIFLFAALTAIQCVPVNKDAQRHPNRIQNMKHQIEEISEHSIKAIQDVEAESGKGRHFLLELSNSFAHNIQDLVYELQRLLPNFEGEESKVLQQSVQQFTDVAFSIQKAANAEPNQMKLQIKQNIEKLTVEVVKMINQLQEVQRSQHIKEQHVRIMTRIITNFHLAYKKLNIQIITQNESIEEIYNRLHKLASDLGQNIVEILGNDQEIGNDLSDFVQIICQKINKMNDRFQRETFDQDGQIKSIMQYAASRLSEARRDLEQVVNKEGNTHHKTNLLKEQLNRTVLDSTTELQRLLQIVRQSNEPGKLTIKNAILDNVAITDAIQTQLELWKKDNVTVTMKPTESNVL